jgi:hypothetical protein
MILKKNLNILGTKRDKFVKKSILWGRKQTLLSVPSNAVMPL